MNGLFQLWPSVNHPTIPAKAGIQFDASWIPAFAGMVGVEDAAKNMNHSKLTFHLTHRSGFSHAEHEREDYTLSGYAVDNYPPCSGPWRYQPGRPPS